MISVIELDDRNSDTIKELENTPYVESPFIISQFMSPESYEAFYRIEGAGTFKQLKEIVNNYERKNIQNKNTRHYSR